MSNLQNRNRKIGACKRCGAATTRKYCAACRKQDTTPKQHKAPSAQMSHASAGKSRKKARHGEAKLAREFNG